MRYDVIVIGSGFGGAVSAARLAEAGYRVLVLERGQRWDKSNYPRRPNDAWVWDEHQRGWIEFRQFKTMSVLAAAGVGGGSLVYANVACEAQPFIFDSGWPTEITFNELAPYYERVAKVINSQKLPEHMFTDREELLELAANKLGYNGRYRQVNLTISFDPDWTQGRAEEFSKPFINEYGVLQGTCVHLGDCEIGCPVEAKNTLATNYIPLAEKHGAEIRAGHIVTDIQPLNDGYKVAFEYEGKVNEEIAEIVILAAGSLGSTELLLRCRDVNGSLPRLSSTLGKNWSNNGFIFVPTFFSESKVNASDGPTITGALDFLDGSQDGQAFWIEDGGFPQVLFQYLKAWSRKSPSSAWSAMAHRTVSDCLHLVYGASERLPSLMESLWRRVTGPKITEITHMKEEIPAIPFFVQGLDPGKGTFRLQSGKIELEWDLEKSYPFISAALKTLGGILNVTGGKAVVPFAASPPTHMITPHPLGGVNMGNGPDTGVVNHRGEVFEYKNLYVCDGSIVPTPLGVNPSHTISALAERTAEQIITTVDAEYLVWFGTNRRPVDPKDTSKGYSSERDDVLHYGSCRVFVPRSHRVGSLGLPWWKRLLGMADERLQLLEIREHPAASYWREIAVQLSNSDDAEKQAVVFVHGYNVSFEAAALRAAQMGLDLSVKGAMAFFSWPSRGDPDEYPADTASIEACEEAMTEYLVQFATRSGAKLVHIIAHSMGNRGVLRAVNRIVAQAQHRTGIRFGQIILAAADVDSDTFRMLCTAYSKVATRTTLYVSARDKALFLSKWLYGAPRAGYTPPILIAPGIDTINVTNVDLSILGHGFVANARAVLSDIHSLIVHDADPRQRFGMREERTEAGGRYWSIRA